MSVLEEIDIRIIRELTKNAQTPFTEIAKRLGISSETVRKRYQKMKKEDTIMHSSIAIDLSKIGYNVKSFFMITNKPTATKTATKEALRKMKNIFIVAEIIGEYDLLAIGAAVNLNGALGMMNDIRKLPSVERVNLGLVNDTVFPVKTSFTEPLLSRKLNPKLPKAKKLSGKSQDSD